MSKIILAIDIGSTKISAVIAEISSTTVSVQGHGIVKSQGIKKGIITNIELASKAIKEAIDSAKRISGSNVNEATVSISNAYAKSLSSTGIANISNKDISIKEIDRVMNLALYNANIPSDYEVIHVLPNNFSVDSQDSIEDPFGMNANRLEVNVNIIMTQTSNLSNLTKAVKSAGISIEGVVLSGYASAIATMEEDDKRAGVAVIDLGGQTSNIVIHSGNSIKYNDFLGVGSNHITNDLSMALHTPIQVAEEIKLKYANLLETSTQVIELPIIGEEEQKNEVSLDVIYSVIFARIDETLNILSKSFNNSQLKEKIKGGIILTGGMTKIIGIRELAHSIFSPLPVRISKPNNNIEGLFEELKDPSYSTVQGLLLYNAEKYTQYEINFRNELLHSKELYVNSLSDIKISDSSHNLRVNEKNGQSGEIEDDSIESKSFTFEELPHISKEKNNSLRKFTNWAKQLF